MGSDDGSSLQTTAPRSHGTAGFGRGILYMSQVPYMEVSDFGRHALSRAATAWKISYFCSTVVALLHAEWWFLLVILEWIQSPWDPTEGLFQLRPRHGGAIQQRRRRPQDARDKWRSVMSKARRTRPPCLGFPRHPFDHQEK